MIRSLLFVALCGRLEKSHTVLALLYEAISWMDPELIRKFEEGEREAVASELLKAHGGLTYASIQLHAFNTRFAGITRYKFKTKSH
ncbi:hypothetical protein BDZ97DRAFT_1437072 [Flammula alnicola]|nr:hypothetical protein BDZ97DRAFT_1437072 [Flammula alnicola]